MSSAGFSSTGASKSAAELRGDGDVVVVAVRAHHGDDVPAADGVLDRLGVVRGVDDDHLVVVADDPDVVVDFPTAAVEFEGAVGDDAFDAAAHQSTTTERRTSPRVHLVERLLDLVEPDAFGDELVQRQPALQVEVDQGGEVALGQAVAVPGRLERAAAGEEVDQRHLELHVRRRHADQHHRAGQVASVEGLFPGFGAADGVDDDVGAEAVGEILDRSRPRRVPWR